MPGFIDPTLYRVPLNHSRRSLPAVSTWHDGSPIKGDFVPPYGKCAEFVHLRNPYSPGDRTADIHYQAEAWTSRISLLSWHLVHLVDSLELWVTQVPDEGPVRAAGAIADGLWSLSITEGPLSKDAPTTPIVSLLYGTADNGASASCGSASRYTPAEPRDLPSH